MDAYVYSSSGNEKLTSTNRLAVDIFFDELWILVLTDPPEDFSITPMLLGLSNTIDSSGLNILMGAIYCISVSSFKNLQRRIGMP